MRVDHSPSFNALKAEVSAIVQQALVQELGKQAPIVDSVDVYKPAENPAVPGDWRRLVLVNFKQPEWPFHMSWGTRLTEGEILGELSLTRVRDSVRAGAKRMLELAEASCFLDSAPERELKETVDGA